MWAVLEFATIVLSGVAAVGAFSISIYFARSPHGIARAVAIDKAAEAINMVVIFVFAVFYWFGIFTKMPVQFAVLLRLLAISATNFSTLHLAYQTRRVTREGKQNDGRSS